MAKRKIKIEQLKKNIKKNKKELYRAGILALLFIGFLALTFDYNRNEDTVGKTEGDIDFSIKEKVSLVEWMAKDVSFECEIYESGRKVIMRHRDGITRLEGAGYDIELDVPVGTRPYALYRGDWLYYWQGEFGVKYDLTKDEAAAEEFNLSKKINDYTERRLFTDCKETEVNSVFAVPSLGTKYEDKTEEAK